MKVHASNFTVMYHSSITYCRFSSTNKAFLMLYVDFFMPSHAAAVHVITIILLAFDFFHDCKNGLKNRNQVISSFKRLK